MVPYNLRRPVTPGPQNYNLGYSDSIWDNCLGDLRFRSSKSQNRILFFSKIWLFSLLFSLGHVTGPEVGFGGFLVDFSWFWAQNGSWDHLRVYLGVKFDGESISDTYNAIGALWDGQRAKNTEIFKKVSTLILNYSVQPWEPLYTLRKI